MKIYKKNNVYEESLKRIQYLFDEFEDIYACVSGGKDSTIIYQLALQVAKEKNRLPLKVLFIDQEAEWQATINYVKKIMYSKEVEPYWLQCEFKLFNATSTKQDWLYCWEKDKEWIREKDEISIKENKYNTDRFVKLFDKFIQVETKRGIYLSGVRTEESPSRYLATTSDLTYKDITWGKKISKNHFTFYPIYDWKYIDVWKCIHDNKYEYNKVYDYQYQYGINVIDMRVSNLHHETAVKNLFYLQEVEPNTYDKISKRLNGINAATKFNKDYFVKKLPYMFSDWEEYKDFLLEKLITDEEKKKKFKKKFKAFEKKYLKAVKPELVYREEIQTILTNDYFFTKLNNRDKKLNLLLKDWKRKNNLL